MSVRLYIYYTNWSTFRVSLFCDIEWSIGCWKQIAYISSLKEEYMVFVADTSTQAYTRNYRVIQR